MIWARFPFVRWMLALASGILLWVAADLAPVFPHEFALLLLASAMLSVLVLKKRHWRRWQALSGTLMFASIALFGWHWAYIQTEELHGNHLLHQAWQKTSGYQATVASVQQGENRTQAVLDIHAVRLDSGWISVKGKANVSWPAWKDVRIGQVLVVLGKLEAPKLPKNPETFDYSKYLKIKQIDFTHYNPACQAIRQPVGYFTKLSDMAQRMGNWLEGTLKIYLPHPTSYDIARALLLGRKTGLDTDLRDAYAKAGAMHVLAVSGLHVGILFGIAVWCLRWLGNDPKGRYTRLSVLLLLLWSYALLTGLSASVVRAASMCSLLAIGQAANRRGNGFNTVAAAAFGMLLIDPWWIADVGFQLSFMAVLGIMLIYQPLFVLWAPSSRVGQYVWQLLCVSMAAQIGTFPLGLCYFHQFPGYFLLSNLVVVPAAGLLLSGSMLLVLASIWPPLAVCIGWLLSWSIHAMNWAVAFIGALPNQLFEGLFIDKISVLLCYLLIFSILAVYYWEKIWPMFIALSAGVALACIEYMEMKQQEGQQWVAAYYLNKRLNIGLASGGQSYWLADSLDTQWALQAKPHLQQAGTRTEAHTFAQAPKHLPVAALGKEAWLLVWGGKPILCLGEVADTLWLPAVDLSIIGNHRTLRGLKRKPLEAKTLIVPFRNKWVASPIPTHVLYEQGYWQLNCGKDG